MPFRLDTLYHQIPGPRTEATFGAVMEMLLKTRLKLKLETNREGYDEDVNAYLAGLLVSYIDPGYVKAVSQVLSQYNIDVYEAVAKAQDNKVRIYWIYKVNADDLLMALGIFHRIWEEWEGEMYRLKAYYNYASQYQRRIYGKATAVGEIQSKLADGTQRYLTILSSARSDYLHLIEPVGSEELAAFSHQLKKMETEAPLKAKWDEFLDAYSAWVKGSRDPDLTKRLFELSEELSL